MIPKLFDPAGPEVQHPTPNQMRQRSKRMRSRVTVGEVVDRYLQHMDKTAGFAPRTRGQAESILKRFVKAHGPRPVTELLPFHVTDFIETNPTWKTTGTRLRVAAGINAALNWAASSGRIFRNPVKGVRYDPSEPREPMDDVSFERYCNAAQKPLERVMRFMRYTGCRPGEPLNARWEDLDLDKGIWTLHKHKTRRKTRKPKLKVLVPEAVKLLRQIGPQPFGPVFVSCLGRPWKDSGSLGRAFKTLKEKLGEDNAITLHSIRHRFATAALAAGAPLLAVAEQLGHDSTRTTERYSHMRAEVESVRAATMLAQPKA